MKIVLPICVYIYVYTSVMSTRAKVFQNGGSQAVRLPKACRFPDGAGEVRAIVYKKRKPSPRTVALLAKIERDDTQLVDLRFHDLRHEATSRLFEKGLGIMEVASMTGHKSLAMLKRYTHIEAEKLARKLG